MHQRDEDKLIFFLLKEDPELEKMLFNDELDIEYLYFNNILGMLYKGDFVTYQPVEDKDRFGLFDRVLPLPGFDMKDDVFIFCVDNVNN